MNVPCKTGYLIELSENENKLRELYFDIKYNSWRNQFIKDNGIRMNTAVREKLKLVREHFELEGEGDNIKIKFTTPEQTKEGEEAKQPEPICKEGKTKEEYEVKMKALMEKEQYMKI